MTKPTPEKVSGTCCLQRQTLLHTYVFTHKSRTCLYMQMSLHTNACAHKRLCTQTPLHTNAFARECLHTRTPLKSTSYRHKHRAFNYRKFLQQNTCLFFYCINYFTDLRTMFSGVLKILFSSIQPRTSDNGYIIQFFPITVPGQSTLLQPISL